MFERCRHSAGILVALVACVSCSSNGRHARDGSESALQPSGVPDAWYDWHPLLIAPFGTLLKDSPIPVHEVLLFHDDPPAADEPQNTDCYALDTPAPRFLGRLPDHYLLCFDHDRLNRIEASIQLSAADAAPVFARGCAVWLNNSASTAGASACEGRDAGIAFSARLAAVPGKAAVPGEGAMALSMTLADARPPHAP